MEKQMQGKRRRVYSFNPNAITYTNFTHKYISYLLPALLRAINWRRSTRIEQIVRFEVDMALVYSTDESKWSRALKHKLEEGIKENKHFVPSTKCQTVVEISDHFGLLNRFSCLHKLTIPRPILLKEATEPRNALQRKVSKKRDLREEEELACRIRILQRILPGGSEMGVAELLSEVENYVVCLQLQVNVLRSLVDA